ncbi:MAG TPA: FG-GAP-like repeat-containing protein [Terriglobales bacterium]|nr:FG-GAP-like repeat-containing protein [Terriglobales bacterium]
MRSVRTFGVCLIFLGTLAMAQTSPPPVVFPIIEQPLVPTAAQPGGAGFTLTINGVGFYPQPTAVLWREGTNAPVQLTITSVNAKGTQLTATVPMADIAAAGTASVSVQTNISDLVVHSNVEFFQIATPASPLFAGPVFYGTGGTTESVLAADFNGDGILDLAVGLSLDPADVCVLLGNGDGTFQNPTCYDVDEANAMVAGVFTNDGTGLPDLAVGDELLKNNGDGTFTRSQFFNPEGFEPYAVGDFNQTGALSIAGYGGGMVVVEDNNGEGSFTQGQSFGGVTQFGGMLTADFNGDGLLDLAVLDISTDAPTLRVFLGSTDGFVTVPVDTTTQAGAVSFTAADFNGDSKQDLAIAFDTADDNEVSILLGNGDGTFTSSGGQFTLINPNGPILTADFNKDGKLDLATGSAIVLGNGDGTFQGTTPIYFEGDAYQEILATGDFNGDGRPDLVTLADSGIYVYLQQAPTGAPVVSLSPTSLTFAALAVGTTSASQAVTLSNTGTAALNIGSISVSGSSYAEFSQTNNCGTSLAMAATCTITVTATPTSVGPVTASISITDNAAGSPQTVALAGTGSPFALTTSCTSLTVVPGQSAIFTVDLAPAGENSPSVTLACSGAPTPGSCTVSNIMNPLTGATTAQVTATTAQMTGFLQPPLGRSNGNRMAGLVGLAGIAGLAALVVLPGKRRGKPGRRLYGLILLLCLLATLAMLPSCASGGGGVDPPGTPPGTYPLTVTGTYQPATGAAITETVSFNLVVK